MNAVILSVILCVCLAGSAYCQQRGTQLRLTQKGLDYTIKESLKILNTDLNRKTFKDFTGRDGSLTYTVSNLDLKNFNIGHGTLVTRSGVGLTASVSDTSTNIYGRLRYEKRVWGFKVRDTVNIRARASRVSFSMSITIGKGPGGKPAIGVRSCSSSVGYLSLRFSGSKASWLYNLFSNAVEKKLKTMLSDLMCKAATRSLNKRGAAELARFQVRKPIDRLAMVDYSMTAAPKFTNEYMDVFIKGEFLLRKDPSQHSPLAMKSFPTSSLSNKMVYIWLSEYTINTAGEVYHKSGILDFNFNKDSKGVSPLVKVILNTNRFRFLVPELARRYPNRPLGVRLHSYKPPKVEFKSGKIDLFVFAAATFQVQLPSGKYVDVFSIQLDVKADASVSVTKKIIKGSVTDFTLKMRTTKSTIGPVNIPVDQPFFMRLVKGVVLKKAKGMLQKGFPLPNLDDVDFVNPEIAMQEGVIRVGVDCLYTKQ